MEKEIKLNQWYLKITEYPKEDNCLFKTTELFYALEYNSQYDMYSGYYVSLFQYGSTEDFKKTNQVCFNDNKTLYPSSLGEYEPISCEKAEFYMGCFIIKYFNLIYANRDNSKRSTTL